MQRRRIGLALLAMMASGASLGFAWPHAREAGVMLMNKDDPAELSDTRVNSALRNNEKILTDQIEAALAAHDASLAQSFVELADAKNIELAEDLRGRVRDACAEENSTSHFASRF